MASSNASGSAEPFTCTSCSGSRTSTWLTPGSASRACWILRAQPPQVAPEIRISTWRGKAVLKSFMVVSFAATLSCFSVIPVFDQATDGVPVRSAIGHFAPDGHGVGHSVAQRGEFSDLAFDLGKLALKQIPHHWAG